MDLISERKLTGLAFKKSTNLTKRSERLMKVLHWLTKIGADINLKLKNHSFTALLGSSNKIL